MVMSPEELEKADDGQRVLEANLGRRACRLWRRVTCRRRADGNCVVTMGVDSTVQLSGARAVITSAQAPFAPLGDSARATGYIWPRTVGILLGTKPGDDDS